MITASHKEQNLTVMTYVVKFETFVGACVTSGTVMMLSGGRENRRRERRVSEIS